MPTATERSGPSSSTLELDDPRAAVELDVVAAATAGVRAIRVAGHSRLSLDDSELTTTIVRLLREAASVGIPVTWHGSLDAGIDSALLVHLAPPAPAPDDDGGRDDPALRAWRDRYRPGLCYYRLGPGFAFVKDVRTAGVAGARFRLELDDPATTLTSLEAVVDLTTADAATLEVLGMLEEERLVVRIGDRATLLPYRMRRWPVPALAV